MNVLENDDFFSLMSYRNTVVEDKIEECMAAARRGETEISIDRGDLTDSEAEYLRREVKRRIDRGIY